MAKVSFSPRHNCKREPERVVLEMTSLGTDYRASGRFIPAVPVSVKSFRSYLWQKRCVSNTIITLTVIFLLTLLLPLAMIPIHVQIGDRAMNFSAMRGTENGESLVLLTEINSLWHSSVVTDLSLSPGETATVWLADTVQTTWFNLSRSQETIPVSHILYALAGSEITYLLSFGNSASPGMSNMKWNLTVTLLHPKRIVCQNISAGSSETMIPLSCALPEAGYYSVQISLSPQTIISEYTQKLMQYNLHYYQQSDFPSCTFTFSTGSNSCEGLPVDEIDTLYQLIASFDLDSSLAGMNDSVQVSISLNGRQTWYYIIPLLLVPSLVCVGIVLITLFLVSRQYKLQLKCSNI